MTTCIAFLAKIEYRATLANFQKLGKCPDFMEGLQDFTNGLQAAFVPFVAKMLEILSGANDFPSLRLHVIIG